MATDSSTPSVKDGRQALLKELETRFGATKSRQLFQAILKTTETKVGKDTPLLVADGQTFAAEIRQLLAGGTFGIGSDLLLKFDAFLLQQRQRKEVVLRFLKHYLLHEDFRAVTTSFTLKSVVEDQKARSGSPGAMIGPLYEVLNKLRYGRPIYNLVSTGRLLDDIYPKMRAIENKASPAGRLKPDSSNAEKIRQVFYEAIQPDAKKMWLRKDDKFEEIFDNVQRALTSRFSPVPYLHVYGAGAAWTLAKEVGQMFAITFPQFEVSEVPQDGNLEAGYVRFEPRAGAG